ncbi:ATP-binding protein [Pseudenhygromyxa sp. WMMC2535]|uniref:ATP-binding protein n=1 Tax=Pseudenhygromyxa sp. WMMC2535 TaxID=2712867 RepID=UPI0015554006|nr:ATP-binding protein [Pseudenhygromyxa sp. WMMC2535]NVB38607.1 ATP-binding protein [Pseudenhygromyxa sp. WMMC2535]
MADLRSRAKAFYAAFDVDRPINFGLDELIASDMAKPEAVYVERIHGVDESSDPVLELVDQIEYSQTNGAYLFTGNRGSGKTTELMRLAKTLRATGHEILYVDLAEHLPGSGPVELSDLLIAQLGAIGGNIEARFGSLGKPGFLERVWSFFQAEPELAPLAVPGGPAELKAALLRTPAFRVELQRRLRGKLHKLIELAQQFVVEVVNLVRIHRGDPYRKVVLITDSLEHLRGAGGPEEAQKVFVSMEALFVRHADVLRLPGLSAIYTVPPSLPMLAPSLAGLYAGGRVFTLPSVQIYEHRPRAGEAPEPSERGIAKLLAVVERRYNWHGGFFTAGQLRRLAVYSGADLRDFFRLLRLAVSHAARGGLPTSDTIFAAAEGAVRRDMLPLTNDERAWLRRIGNSSRAETPRRNELLEFARMLQNKQVLICHNGDEWYTPHPLLRAELGLSS